MGWSGGDELFDTIARELFAEELSYQVRVRILYRLIDGLQDHDWDTEDEALRRWSSHPEAVEAFSLLGITPGHSEGLDS